MNFFKKYQTKYPKNPVANAYDSLPTDDIVRRRYHLPERCKASASGLKCGAGRST